MATHRRGTGVLALSGLFAVGAVSAGATCLALLVPGSRLDLLWRLNPAAHKAFLSTGRWAIALMGAVAVACGLAALGLWTRARWGHRLAVALLAVNLLGDIANVIIRGDLHALVGLPIASGSIAYLLSSGVRAEFDPPEGRWLTTHSRCAS